MSDFNDPTVNEADFDITTSREELRATLDRLHQLERKADQVRLSSQDNDSRIPEPMDAIEVGIGLDGVTTVHEHRVIEVTSEDAVGRPSVGVLSTARTQSGTPQHPFDVKAESVVTVQGLEMSALQAFKMGFLRIDQHGRFQEVGESVQAPFDAKQKPEEQEASQEAETTSAHPLALPATQESFLNAVDAQVDPGVIEQAIEDMSNGRGLSEATLKAAAKSFEAEPELIAAHVDGVVTRMQAAVDAEMQRVGVADPRAFYDWAWLNHRREMTKAYRSVVSGRNTSPLKVLASRYLKVLAYAS